MLQEQINDIEEVGSLEVPEVVQTAKVNNIDSSSIDSPRDPGMSLLSAGLNLGGAFADSREKIATNVIVGPDGIRLYDATGKRINRFGDQAESAFRRDYVKHLHISEGSKEQGNYGLAGILKDKAGISFGAYQLTEDSGNLKGFLKDYAKYDDKAAEYLKKFKGNLYTGNRGEFMSYLKKQGNTDLGKEVQDAYFEKTFWKPGLKRSQQYDFKDARARAVYIDSIVNGGPYSTIKRAYRAGPLTYEVLAKARKDYYKSLVKRDPSKKQYLAGWLRRVDRIKDYIKNEY